jgi:hypothetical protein
MGSLFEARSAAVIIHWSNALLTEVMEECFWIENPENQEYLCTTIFDIQQHRLEVRWWLEAGN